MKSLLLAIRKIEAGRATINGARLSIAAVAREAGVTPALIHNSYPTIAALVRSKRTSGGVALAAQRAKKSRQEVSDLRKEVAMLKSKVAKIASVNEMLTMENARLVSMLEASNVVSLKAGRRPRR